MRLSPKGTGVDMLLKAAPHKVPMVTSKRKP